MIGCYRINDEGTTTLADTSRYNARLKSCYVSMESPCDIQRRVTFDSQTLSLSSLASIQR